MVAQSLDPEGPAAESMADLWWLMLTLGVAVFVVFAVVLALGLFRRRPPETPEPGAEAPSRFGAWMIGAGVAVPLVVIAVVFAATVQTMRAVPTTAPADALVIDVVGHQWWWEVHYPEEDVTTANEMHIPVGRPVALRLTSADVIHSFWVPALAGKLDMLPDKVNTLVWRRTSRGSTWAAAPSSAAYSTPGWGSSSWPSHGSSSTRGWPPGGNRRCSLPRRRRAGDRTCSSAPGAARRATPYAARRPPAPSGPISPTSPAGPPWVPPPSPTRPRTGPSGSPTRTPSSGAWPCRRPS